MDVDDTAANLHNNQCNADCSNLNEIQIKKLRDNYLAKTKWKHSNFANYPLLLETFEEYLKQDSIRNFDFYCIHHLKNNEHIEEFKQWYDWAFPGNTWFISNLKYVRGNTSTENENVIDNYLCVNELTD